MKNIQMKTMIITQYIKLINSYMILSYYSKINGDRLSEYYLPSISIYQQIFYVYPSICHYGVMLCNHFLTHRTKILSSAQVKNGFSELKNKILRFDIHPMTSDRFVAKHIISIENNCKLFKSAQLRNDNRSLVGIEKKKGRM